MSRNRRKNPALPLFPTRLSIHPFQMVPADIFQFGGVHYLLLVDEYSKWPCVVRLRTLTSASTIEALDGFFSDFWTSEEILSDNGKQFDCVEFNRFCVSRQVRHITYSPEFPQSNGLAERHIQTVKMSMLKMFQDDKTLWEVLAAVRSTPVSDQLPSPSVLLQGRHLRVSLPFLPSALTPRLIPRSAAVAPASRRGSFSECAPPSCSLFCPGCRPACKGLCKLSMAKGCSRKGVCRAESLLSPSIGWPTISSNALGH